MPRTLSPLARRNALLALFAIPGLGIASWVTRTPDIRDLLHATTAEMGIVLFGLSVGSMAGVLLSGRFVARHGTRPVIVVGMTVILISLPTIALGTALGLAGVVTLGLALFGLGIGTGEIAENIEGAVVEKDLGRSVLPTMHGFFSLGTVVGAALGIWLTAIRFPVPLHLLGVFAVCAAVFGIAIRSVAAHPVASADARESTRASDGRFRPWADRRLQLIGVVILAMALTEGAANDWLPLVMVDGHGFDPSWGSAVYTTFAASMTVGRLAGGWFLARYGRVRVLTASVASAGVGLAGVVFVDSHAVVIAAVVLWGLGSALAFPVALSAAGDSERHSAQRVSFAATAGYIAFLVGPPMLGFVGEDVGVRYALVLVLGFIAVALFCTPAMAPRPSRVTAPTS